jgi:hypothetical protein
MERSNIKYDKKIKVSEKKLKAEEIKSVKKKNLFQKQPLQNPALRF